MVEVVHELPEEERICEKCGGTLEPIPNGDMVYSIERTLPPVPEDAGSPEGERVLAERLRIRRERSRLVVAEIFRLHAELGGVRWS